MRLKEGSTGPIRMYVGVGEGFVWFRKRVHKIGGIGLICRVICALQIDGNAITRAED
jgi:hypothetical protein